jgi:hypothetical protein
VTPQLCCNLAGQSPRLRSVYRSRSQLKQLASPSTPVMRVSLGADLLSVPPLSNQSLAGAAVATALIGHHV